MKGIPWIQIYKCGDKEIEVRTEAPEMLVINDPNGDPYVFAGGVMSVRSDDRSFKQTVVYIEGVRYTLTDTGFEQV